MHIVPLLSLGQEQAGWGLQGPWDPGRAFRRRLSELRVKAGRRQLRASPEVTENLALVQAEAVWPWVLGRRREGQGEASWPAGHGQMASGLGRRSWVFCFVLVPLSRARGHRGIGIWLNLKKNVLLLPRAGPGRAGCGWRL